LTDKEKNADFSLIRSRKITILANARCSMKPTEIKYYISRSLLPLWRQASFFFLVLYVSRYFRKNRMDFGDSNLLRNDFAIIASNEMNRKIYHIDSSTDNGITASEG